MDAAPVVWVACCVVGSCCGAASGSRHSLPLAAAGASVGFVLGLSSFLALVVPYVLVLIQYEKLRPEACAAGPPRVWAWLAVPVMVATLALAAVVSWAVVGLLV